MGMYKILKEFLNLFERDSSGLETHIHRERRGEREKERGRKKGEKEIFLSLLCSPKSYKDQSWTSAESGAKSFL